MELFTKEVLGTLPGAAGATWFIVWALDRLIRPLQGKVLNLASMVIGEGMRWVEKLPGPYTLIFKLTNKKAVHPLVNAGQPTIGVRIPKHWFSEVVAKLNFPVITTSVNVTGEEPMRSIDDLDERIRSKLDFIIYEGEKKGRPSTLVKLIEPKPEIIKR